MLIRRFDQVPSQSMTMPGARGVAMRLLVGREHGAPNFAMRQFEVEPHGHTPLHQHNYEHEVLILEGRGHLVSGHDGATTRPLAAGDVVFVPPNQTHQFRNVADQPLRFICLVPVSYDCGTGCQVTPGS